MAVADPEAHTAGVIAAVDAAVSVNVGDGAPPGGAPYCTVYPVTGGMLNGSLAAPNDDIRFPAQVTCVGRARSEAQYLQAAVRTGLLAAGGSGVTVTGRSVTQVTLEQPSGVTRDDDVGELAGQRVWFTTDVFHVHTTPT